MGMLLEHVHLMDNKIQEMCNVIQSMGGDVCTDSLPKMDMEEFAATGLDPQKNVSSDDDDSSN